MDAVDHGRYVVQPDGAKISRSSAPPVVERMVLLADVEPGHRVLEIGTGSGFTAAVLAEIVGGIGRVVSLDIDDLHGRGQGG